MPEVKNTFLKSKMNKDLDSRLVPNGEYRDAVNVAINRSESSDVGALENIKGNELLNDFGLSASIECIGQLTDDQLNRIYLFFTDWDDENNIATAGSYHSIICYYYDTNTFDVLVDGYFLNFSKTNFIYGVNLLEDLLFWTDNRNQPRKINVERAISAPATSPTPYYSIEETISVAKYYPFDPISFNTEIEIEVSVTTSSSTLDGKQSIITIDPASLSLVENITLHPGLQFYIKNVANLDIPEFPYFHQIKRFPELSFVTQTAPPSSPTSWSGNYNLTPTTNSRSGYFDIAASYSIGDFTTYLDGKIYKAIVPSTGFPPPDLTYWEEVPDTLDRTKFETALPITINNGTNYTGSATLVLIYPEKTNASKQFLPTSYRLRVNSVAAPSEPNTFPGLLQSQGVNGLNDFPITNNDSDNPQTIDPNPPNGGQTPFGTTTPVSIQKSISNSTFEISLSGQMAPNGWGLGTNQSAVGNVQNKLDFLKYFLFPGMRVTSPFFPKDQIVVIDQTFPEGFRTSAFEFTVKQIDKEGNSVDDWQFYVDWNNVEEFWLSFHYPNPFYQYPFKGDELFLKNKFTRLSYRYKFDDGEYSLIAPFTQSLFLPKNGGYFVDQDLWWDNRVNGEYSQQQGYVSGVAPFDINDRNELSKSNINRLMENQINKVNLDIPMPYINGQQLDVQDLKSVLKVDKIQVLLKDDNETSIKVIEAIDTDDLSIIGNTSKSYEYLYNGQKPIKVLPDKEITRVYDKVPIKALAQEVSGNRVMYGNYVDKHTSPVDLNFSVGVSRKFKVNETNSEQCGVEYPNHTLKQNRTYRVGIVLADKFGRQSDVVTGPVIPESFILNGISFEGDTINSRYIRPNDATLPLQDLKYPFSGPGVYTYPLEVDLEAGSNIVDWVGETIKLVFNEAIPTSGAEGYPDIYDKDTNPLGWYSYKVVVKQQEHEYYNIYLNGITNGELFDTTINIPFDYDNVALFTLIGDNLNKISINYQNFDLGNDVKYFTSDQLLYPRVSSFGAIDKDPTGWVYDSDLLYVAQVFNEEQYEKILNLGSIENITDTSASNYDNRYIYKGNKDPFMVRISNDADMGINLLSDPEFIVDFGAAPTLYENHTFYQTSIIETSPTKSNLDIFWETTTTGLISDVVVDEIIEVKYFNTFWNKNINTGMTAVTTNSPIIPAQDTKTWPGPVSYFDALTGTQLQNDDFPSSPLGFVNDGLYRNASEALSLQRNWYIEESRIFGGFNNDIVGLGVRAYLNEEESIQERRANSLIYSGVYNSRTGFNETNVFSIGENITKSLDPANGSIQKLFAEDTNLIIFQEDKISKALIDKDAIYSAEGNAAVTSTNLVIGQIAPYLGEFGISTNPESFAYFGFSKYFVDRQKGSVLRLSRDGITEISEYGMRDFFRDNLGVLNNSAKIVGGWDIRARQYVISIQNQNGSTYKTLGFDEGINGWVSRFSYKPSLLFSLNNNYLTFEDNGFAVYQHYSDNVDRCNFYGVSNDASINFILNSNPSLMKNFKTMSYEGSNGWEVNSVISDPQGRDFINSNWEDREDATTVVKSYEEGKYTDGGVTYRSGFNRKENRYVANLINNSVVKPGEVVFGDQMSGIKGYFADVVMTTDSTTDPGGYKELFLVSSNFSASSY